MAATIENTHSNNSNAAAGNTKRTQTTKQRRASYAINPKTGEVKELRPRPPDGGYGWVIVVAAFMNGCIVGGTLICFPMIYYDVAQHFEVSLAVTGLISSFTTAFVYLPSVMYSVLVSNFGSRRVTIIGSLLSCVGYALGSLAFSVPWMYFTYGLFSGVGLGLQSLSKIVIVNKYFDKKRSIANGVALAGTSVGILVMSFVIQTLIEAYTWRGTLLICSGIALNGCVSGALYRPLEPANAYTKSTRGESRRQSTDSQSPSDNRIRRRSSLTPSLMPIQENKDLSKPEVTENPRYTSRRFSQQVVITPSHVGDKLKRRMSIYVVGEVAEFAKMRVSMSFVEKRSMWKRSLAMFKQSVNLNILKDVPFILIAIASFFSAYAMTTFGSHNVNRARIYGVPAEKLATLPTATGLCTGMARIISGLVGNSKYINHILMYGFGILACGIVNMAHSFADVYPTIVIYSALYGFTTGTFMTSMSQALVKLEGIEKIAQSLALCNLFFGTGCLICTPLAGMIYDVTGNYDLPFQFGACAAVLSFFLTCMSYVLNKRKEIATLDIPNN